ncbi:hypothetical protein BJ165DRAFT_1477790 [Panaeolus papilionaceus]|nr:hypothetical protein BJ165DRAFT_1477790 [Panaeolus papilionaceus]
MLPYSDLQAIAHRLGAAASAISTDKKTVHTIETSNSSLISKAWTDQTLISETTIVDFVRPNSSAAYMMSPDILETIVYVDPSSRLRVLEFDEESEDWFERASNEILYEVDPLGNLAACSNGHGSISVFFQRRKGILATFNLDEPLLTSEIHLHIARGSPLWAGFIRGAIHIFYISTLDRCVHFAKQKDVDSGWVDKVWTRQPFKEMATKFYVVPDLSGSRVKYEAYVLTQDMSFLHIATNGQWSKLGRVDQRGDFVSENNIDICCIEAQNNTLTEERLGELLATDPSIIDAVGGPLNVTPLAAACWNGHLEAATLLLDNPFRLANPSSISPKNRTPLYFAVALSPPGNRREIVAALIDAGADVDASSPDDYGNTPLMIAVADTGDVEVVQELMSRGASLTKTNMRGQTASMLASGSNLEQELRPLGEPNMAPHSVQKEVVDVLVAITILIVAYFNSEYLRDIMKRVLIELKNNNKVDVDDGFEGVVTGEEEPKQMWEYEVSRHPVTHTNMAAAGPPKLEASRSVGIQEAVLMSVEEDQQTTLVSPMGETYKVPQVYSRLPVSRVKAATESKARMWWRCIQRWRLNIERRVAQE